MQYSGVEHWKFSIKRGVLYAIEPDSSPGYPLENPTKLGYFGNRPRRVTQLEWLMTIVYGEGKGGYPSEEKIRNIFSS